MAVNPLDPDEIHEWCRHIDTMMWTMGGILTGAIGGLSLYTIEHPSVWTSLSGLGLTAVAAFLVASFRATRRQLHMHLDKRLVDLLRPPRGFKQWPMFAFVLTVLTIVWVRLLIIVATGCWWLWVILGLANIIFVVVCFRRADHAPAVTDA